MLIKSNYIQCCVQLIKKILKICLQIIICNGGLIGIRIQYLEKLKRKLNDYDILINHIILDSI